MLTDSPIALQDLSHSTIHKLITEAAVQAANLLIGGKFWVQYFAQGYFQDAAGHWTATFWLVDNPLYFLSHSQHPEGNMSICTEFHGNLSDSRVQLLKCVFVLVPVNSVNHENNQWVNRQCRNCWLQGCISKKTFHGASSLIICTVTATESAEPTRVPQPNSSILYRLSDLCQMLLHLIINMRT